MSQKPEAALSDQKESRIQRLLYPAGAMVVGLLLWEGLVRVLEIPPYILPKVSGILSAFMTEWRELPWNTWITFVESVGGFLIAAVGGIITSIILIYSQKFEWTVYPYLVLLRTIPIFAIAPLLIVWFGFGIMPKLIVSALIAFFPIVVNMVRGLRAVDYRILELLDSVSATKWQIFAKVRLITSLPYLFASFKIAITSAVVGAIVGEFVGADEGLGYLLIRASTRLDTEFLFVVILILAAMGIFLFFAVSFLEKKLIYWGDEAV